MKGYLALNAMVGGGANTINGGDDDVARFQEDGRLSADADSARCARKDDIAWQQLHDAGQIGNDVAHVKNQVISECVLNNFAVERACHMQCIAIRKIFCVDQPWAKR